MKFLLLSNNSTEPRILEMGKDFDLIFKNKLWQTKNNIGVMPDDDKFIVSDFSEFEIDDVSPFEFIANISDCYQSRHLIETNSYNNSFCEFDVIYFDAKEWGGDGFVSIFWVDFKEEEFDYGGGGSNQKDGEWRKSLGTIFTPENRKKYPELYQQANEIITP